MTLASDTSDSFRAGAVPPAARSTRSRGRPVLAQAAKLRQPLALRLFLVAVFFIPVQLELGGTGDGASVESRLAPSDLFLALALLIAPGLLRLRRRGVDVLPLLLVAVLCYGALLSIVQTGGVNTHTLVVKVFGGVVLALLAVVTANFTRGGHGDRIVKWFLVGMAFWAVVAYVDWRIFDILPFVEAKTDSRFGAMQYDPNNAGAGYGVASIVAWKVGRRVFTHRISHVLCTAAIVSALGLTLSRGGYISTIAAALVLLVFVERPSAQQVIRSIVGVAVLVMAAIVTGLAGSAIADFTNRPDTVGDRGDLAGAGLSDFAATNGTGIGLGTYREQYDQIIHNTGLWLLVEMSVVGLIFFAAVIVIPAVAALALRRTDSALGSALFGAHVVMVVISLNIEAMYQRQWWLVIGLIAGSAAVASTRRSVDA